MGLIHLQDRFRFIWVWYPYRIGFVSYGFGTPTGSVSFHMGLVPLQDRFRFIWVLVPLQDRFASYGFWYHYRIGFVSPAGVPKPI